MESAVFELEGVVQHYEWGGYEFIPRLLGLRNPDRKRFAELWMGAHPKGPALAELDGGAVPLDRAIARNPQKMLGPGACALLGGRLPYLFKVLDVGKMLSIQAHPTRAQSQAGFARQNAAGIPLEAEARDYRDDNHKPEIGVALTDFWMLHGFRPLSEIREALASEPELNATMPEFAQRLTQAGTDSGAQHQLLRELYGRIMTLPQAEVDALLGPLLSKLATRRHTKNDRGYWALRAVEQFPLSGGHYDRGVFSIYLLNLVHLQPGQGTFQPAGVLHAYLDGVNVELMANSDNVLRGGLTTKHVDVPELLRILTFEAGTPQILDGVVVHRPHSGSIGSKEPSEKTPTASGWPASGYTERIYRTSAEEFELARIEIEPGASARFHAAEGPDSLLLLEGTAIITSAGRTLPLHRGSIVFVPFDAHYVLEGGKHAAMLFRASLPRL